MNFISLLKDRELIYQCTNEDAINNHILQKSLCCYLGVDLTSDSLHIGHLIPLKLLTIFSQHNQKAIFLFGKATTMVGDPSMKTKERPMLSVEEISTNMQKIQQQVVNLIPKAIFEDNSNWLSSIGVLDFLREVGTKFSVNQLVNLETFKNRLTNNMPLSFLEFSYPTLQAYDFYKLHKKYGCNVQIGGSDQWGNIISGINLVRKMAHEEVFGITLPLLLINGEKMGKSTGKPVWLDSTKTSVFDFWQFWRNIPDSDVETYLRRFTDLEVSEIETISTKFINEGKKMLADQITTWVHGEEQAQAANKKSISIFEKKETDHIDKFTCTTSVKLTELLVKIGFASSISDAKRKICNGSINIDNVICHDEKRIIDQASVIGYGKKQKKSVLFS
ncbi:MAG: tyrosine--tRNA ligase [Alphaproteobacteria bacterium]|nr:MAG: tyrosine--tRNA ligase [Alphaproteobacteria bacterium]